MDNHYKKYLKYKRKYLNQKYLQIGGGRCLNQDDYNNNNNDCVSSIVLQIYDETKIHHFNIYKPLPSTNKIYFYTNFLLLMSYNTNFEKLYNEINEDKNKIIQFHACRERTLGDVLIPVSYFFNENIEYTCFKISLISINKYIFNITFNKEILKIEIEKNMKHEDLYLSILEKYFEKIDYHFTTNPGYITDRYSTYLYYSPKIDSNNKILIDDKPLTNTFYPNNFEYEYNISLETKEVSRPVSYTPSPDTSSSGILVRGFSSIKGAVRSAMTGTVSEVPVVLKDFYNLYNEYKSILSVSGIKVVPSDSGASSISGDTGVPSDSVVSGATDVSDDSSVFTI